MSGSKDEASKEELVYRRQRQGGGQRVARVQSQIQRRDAFPLVPDPRDRLDGDTARRAARRRMRKRLQPREGGT